MKVGDCVSPKDGGYIMTVAIVCGEAIDCMWFDEHQQLRKQQFNVGDLIQWERRK